MSTGRTTSEADELTPGDSRDNDPSSRNELHPVPSGGFSASSISEEFVKDLLRVKECLESSLETMQKGDGAQQEKGTEEIVVDDQHKPAKDEANRELRFQIMQNPPKQAVNQFRHCHCGHSRGTCPKANRNHNHKGHRSHTCHRVIKGTHSQKHHCHCSRNDRSSSRSSHHRSCSGSCHTCSHRSSGNMNQKRKCKHVSEDLKEPCRHKKTSDRPKKDEDAPEVFRRYRSSYSSSDSSSSSCASADEASAADRKQTTETQGSADVVRGKGTADRRECERSSKNKTSRKIDGVTRTERKSRRHVKKFNKNDLEEATVEKHILELNFPRSPGLTSISNLLQQPTDEEDDVRVGEDELVKRRSSKLVHQIRPGQTCELLTDGQVIRVCLPERNRMTVEHVIEPAGDMGESGYQTQRRRGNPGRKKNEMFAVREVQVETSESEEEEWVSGEEQKHQARGTGNRTEEKVQRHLRDATGRKGGNAKAGRHQGGEPASNGLPVMTRIISNTASSSDSDDSGGDDIPSKRPPSSNKKFKNRKQTHLAEGNCDDNDSIDDNVCLLSSLKNRRVRSRDKWTSSRGPGEVAFRLRESRRVSRRRDGGSGVDDADDDVVASRTRRGTGNGPRLRVSSTVSLTPDGNGRNGNSFRVVFTDSNLNTELRYILQDGHGTARHQSNLIITKDNNRQESPRRKQKGAGRADEHHSDCGTSTVLENPRRTPNSSDIISSSYYSSTHESSLVLNDKKGGCKLCNAMSVVNKGCRNDACLHDDKRHRRQRKPKNAKGRG